MSETGAGAALEAAAIEAVRNATGVGVYRGPPVQAAAPYAVVEAGPESDWSHKSGDGRELRLAVTIHDKGEAPARLRPLAAAAEKAIGTLPGELDGWRLVTVRFLRSMTVPPRAGSPNGSWAALIEFRARMLRAV